MTAVLVFQAASNRAASLLEALSVSVVQRPARRNAPARSEIRNWLQRVFRDLLFELDQN